MTKWNEIERMRQLYVRAQWFHIRIEQRPTGFRVWGE